MSDFDGMFRQSSKGFVKDYTDLLEDRTSFQLSKEIFELTKRFPEEERYALTDQFRRAVRSVEANIAEAWGKLRYEKHFISKLTDDRVREDLRSINFLAYRPASYTHSAYGLPLTAY